MGGILAESEGRIAVLSEFFVRIADAPLVVIMGCLAVFSRAAMTVAVVQHMFFPGPPGAIINTKSIDCADCVQ